MPFTRRQADLSRPILRSPTLIDTICMVRNCFA